MDYSKYTRFTAIILGCILGFFGVYMIFFNQRDHTEGERVSLAATVLGKISSDTFMTTEEFVNSDMVEGDEFKTYRNEAYGFQFEYPSSLTATEFSENIPAESDVVNGEVLLFQEKNGIGGFQIFVAPFDEPNISAERIRKDIPNVDIQKPVRVLVGSENIPALIFLSGGDSEGLPFDELREVWFSDRGYLYQITAPSTEDALLGRVLESWRRME